MALPCTPCNSTNIQIAKTYKIKRILVSFTLCVLLSFTLNTHGLSVDEMSYGEKRGWKKNQQGSITTYSKPSNGASIHIRLMPWQVMSKNDLVSWMKKQWVKPYGPVSFQKKSGKKPSVASAKDKRGTYFFSIASRIVKYKNQTYASILTACQREGYVLLAHVYGPGKSFTNKTLMNQNTNIIGEHCEQGPSKPQSINTKAVKSNDKSNQTSISTSQSTAQIKPITKRPDFKKVALPKDFKELWYVARFVAGVNGARAKQDVVALFNNKEVTEDLNTIFAQGKAFSKKKNPKDWGVANVSDKEMTIKWDGKTKYRDYYLTRKAQAGKKDQRLNRCFSSRSGASIGFGGSAVHSVSIRKWCFGNNGRFSNKSAVGVSGSGPSSTGYAGGDKEGYYHIDGYVIHLAYDNGNKVVTSFGLLDQHKQDTYLLLGTGVYN
jgi:hypothetical protein